MTDTCGAFEGRRALYDSAHPKGQADWADHVRACGPCQEQEAADRALRDLFAGSHRPDLPPYFAQRTANRTALIPPAGSLGVRARTFLRAYWVMTVIVGAVMVLRADFPAAVSPVVAAGAMVTTVAVLAPILLLAHLRGGLLTLMRRVVGQERV